MPSDGLLDQLARILHPRRGRDLRRRRHRRRPRRRQRPAAHRIPRRPGRPPAHDVAQRRRARRWTGRRYARPASTIPRIYERSWNDDWGWQVIVRPATADGRRPTEVGKPLWLRRHRAHDDPEWRTRYDWTDEWEIPDSNARQRLASDLIADAVDAERTSPFRNWNQAPYIARHFAADVLHRRLGDTAWRMTRDEVLNWLNLHGYLEPVT